MATLTMMHDFRENGGPPPVANGNTSQMNSSQQSPARKSAKNGRKNPPTPSLASSASSTDKTIDGPSLNNLANLSNLDASNLPPAELIYPHGMLGGGIQSSASQSGKGGFAGLPGLRERTGSMSSTSSTSSTSTISALPARAQYEIILVLVPLNGTFKKKYLDVPFAPNVLKLGRQVNQKTAPSPTNGYFDSRVLSRQHAEIWAQKSTGKVWIRDSKSSNGTYINGERLSGDNTESQPYQLKKNDILELGIDISNEDGISLVHKKISAKIERISVISLQSSSSNAANGSVSVSDGLNGSVRGDLSAVGGAGNPLRGDSLEVALFGDMDVSLEELADEHAQNSMSGAYLTQGISSAVSYQPTIRKLVGEIHKAQADSMKLSSIHTLLVQLIADQQRSKILSKYQQQTTDRDMIAKLLSDLQQAKRDCEDKDRYIVDLENTIQQQAAMLSEHSKVLAELREVKAKLDESETFQQQLQPVHSVQQPAPSKKSENMTRPTSPAARGQHQLKASNGFDKVVPLSSAAAVVVVGISIMALLNITRER